MDAVPGSSSTQNEVGKKPLIKRKVGQSLLDAFWLEIIERPLKRPTLDLSKLSISDSDERGLEINERPLKRTTLDLSKLSISNSDEREDVKPKKVLVQHLETVRDSKTTGEKPVIVRVKRKVGQSLLDAFWLEINKRPLKRTTLNLSKLSISGSGEREDVKPEKVLVQHLETVTDSKTTSDIIHSFFASDLNEQSYSKGKVEKRKIAFKNDGRKEQHLTRAVQQQQIAAGNARFEQIWRSRKGNKEGIHDKELYERCHFYDVIRVDVEERRATTLDYKSLEDQKMMASFLPLLKECIPTAAEEIEADIQSSSTEHVYDYYAVNKEMDISEDSSKNQFPLVIVEDEEDFCDGPDESDNVPDNSNAGDHQRNDYPEISGKSDTYLCDSAEDHQRNDYPEEISGEYDYEETTKSYVRRVLGDDELDAYEDVYGYIESDEEFVY